MHHRKNSSLAHINSAENGVSSTVLPAMSSPTRPQASVSTTSVHGAGAFQYHVREKESVSYFSSLSRLQETSPRSSSSSENLSAGSSLSSSAGHEWEGFFAFPPSSPGTPSKLYPHSQRSLQSSPSSDSPTSPLASVFSSLQAAFAAVSQSPSPHPARSVSSLLPLKGPATVTALPLPRFNRRRTVALSFLALFALCIWTLLTSSLQTPTFIVRRPSAHALGVGNLDRWKSFRRPSTSHPPSVVSPDVPLQLSPPEELAALVAFISTLSTNSLPPSVDPSVPLDPSAILSFDLSRLSPAQARDELSHVSQETWAMHPVVVFGKARHPPTRALRMLLDGYGIDPLPSVFQIDQRPDRELLMPVLRRIVGPDAALAPAVLAAVPDPDADADSGLDLVEEEEDEGERARALEAGVRLPMLFVAGQFIPQRDIPRLVEDGGLLEMIKDSGARTGVARKKGKGH